MKVIRILLLVCSLTFAGCWSTPYTLTKRSSIDAQIEAVRQQTTTQLAAISTRETETLNAKVTAIQAQQQAAADHLFKGSVVGAGLKTPTRPEMVMNQSIQQTAAQLPPATPSAQAKTLKDLQGELDESRTSNEVLRAQYEKELGAARTEGEVKAAKVKELDKQLEQTDKDRIAALNDASAKTTDLNKAKDKIQDGELAAKQKALDDAKHNETLKRWLMAGLGVIALVAGAAAVYLPIPGVKSKLTLVAIAAAILAFCVPFIEWYHVLIAVLVICTPIAIAILRDYNREHSDATDTYRALNEVKTKASTIFKTDIAPILDQWHTNPDTTKRIDERLKQVGDT